MSTSPSDSLAPARAVWLANGLPEDLLSHLRLSEHPDPAIPSSFRLGSAAQTSIGLSGLSAANFHALRTGVEQDVTVDARHAVFDISSEKWYTIDGHLPEGNFWDPIAGLYRTQDNNHVRIHTNFPHHRDGILQILGCEATRDAVQAKLTQWNSYDFEAEAASRKMCAFAYRSFDEWDKHPQGQAQANAPPVQLIKIGDAPRRELKSNAEMPLENIRVLDLCRVLAGPAAGRALAAFGADVLLVTSPSLPDLPLLDIETSRGKRTTQLDLTSPSGVDTLRSLAKDADVFLQAYRPGGVDEKGFSPSELAEARPGIVCANLRAFGWDGPWKDRRGFDSLVQTTTGINHAEAEAYSAFTGTTYNGKPPPKPLPMQALDHVAGYFLAFGINAALCKTITEGGSWEVRVSLAAIGQWIRSLGRLDPAEAFSPQAKGFPKQTAPVDPEVAGFSTSLTESPGDDGKARNQLRTMTAIEPAAVLSRTPARQTEAPMGLNRHNPAWLPLKP
ncbi:CoA-transferase family III [Coniophora puteana RWD-64-598 SS2]|uniref:CoA-transferase family III n=1 Tax=Coniophora puteana (strain RWD-64-598) TaxID=741705 RepID=A0A5M3MPK6_CONPW|nr:CoA-transferase family III [Coniophora puteana RWD-64-598 SS2]EIW81119.1 CoA-transferase family III [Coniophora puteana RWD-64-598 SS2]